MKLITCLILIGLATSAFSIISKTIPELYNLSNGSFTSNYSVTYNSAASREPYSIGDFGIVSEAGDINNDGIHDFMIASPSSEGRLGTVYVIYGKKASLRQFNSMNDFQPSDGFIIKGGSGKLGSSISHAGDVNGDGIDDIIIGSPFWSRDKDVNEVGMAYVLFGRKSSSDFPSTVDVSHLSPNQGFKMFGEGGMNWAGCSVSGAGDVNGDGISDIVIGAFGANGESGKAYVIFGSKKYFGDIKLPPDAGKGFTIEGSNQEHFGASVSKVGDFNGDGIDDLIIGARDAYLIYGRRDGFPSVINATDGVIIKGSSFGYTVRAAGDFNGDGLQDLVLGAQRNGAAYVILGSPDYSKEISTNLLDASRAFTVISGQGLQVSGGRDLNGDGLSDIVLSAPAFNRDKGAVYVLYGFRQSSYSKIDLGDLKSNQGYVMYGAREGDRFGAFASPVKDVNNDGVNDLVVGASESNGGKGTAYLFYVALICSENCATCSKQDTCDVCIEGFGLLNNACRVCPEGAYRLRDGVCAPRCSENCGKCSKPFTCDICNPGFGFFFGACTTCPTTCDLIDGACVQKHPPNCAKWTFSDRCELCIDGFGFLGGQCVICPPDKYTLSRGFCIGKHPPNCIQWSSPDTCVLCDAGFGFLGGVCVSCPPDTHVLRNGYCQIKCSENCRECSKPNSCDLCAANYVLFNNTCLYCPQETHTFVNGVCKMKCPENCAQCTQSNKCDFCKEEFGFLGNICVICPAKTHFLHNGFCIENHNTWQIIQYLFGGLFH